MGTNGRTIIEDALALCNYITRHPVDSNWFDNAGAAGSTDDRINSTHDVIYDEELPMTVIKEILEKAKNPAAVQSFDVYETPSGCVIGHLRNSLDFVSPISSITPEQYEQHEDFHRIRNKQKVYGKKERRYPSDEAWTEDITGWTASKGSLSQVTSPRIKNSACIAATATGSPYEIEFYRTFSAIECGSKFRSCYPKLLFSFYIYASTIGAAGKKVRLYAPDSSNYFEWIWDTGKTFKTNEWTEIEIGLGSEFESPLSPGSAYWTKTGSPNWDNIQGIYFFADLDANLDKILFDDLRFFGAHYEGEASDPTSISKYGTRMDKPIVDDSLKSDAECVAMAQSIIAMLKDPVITLSEVVVDGDHRYNPGDRQRVVVSNDGLDAYFRIIKVQHRVKESQWDTILTLSNEPQQIDYVFRLIQENLKKIQRGI